MRSTCGENPRSYWNFIGFLIEAEQLGHRVVGALVDNAPADGERGDVEVEGQADGAGRLRAGGGDARVGELDKLCLAEIARFKRPKDYVFVDALPKNNYGKILKTDLRELDSKRQEKPGA